MMAGLESLLTGRLLADRYRIEEVIGRGGMGAVYRATDERLGRRVAVKVITLAGAEEPGSRERLRQRFVREARAAAALPHHANVVPVYDFGTDETLGLDFLVMELLDGEDLATLLSRVGPPPLATGLRILLGAARGIAVGHRAGLVHRDVKPGNIFLVSDEHGDPQVRVLDFGIAKLVDDDTLSQLTQDGRAPLSPAFASPEQLRGLSRITPASDVFSLGAVGFLVLTGQRPFSEMDRNRFSLGMPVDPPSLRSINPAIPAIVENVIRRSLSFDAAERFPDAIGLARELERARRAAGDEPLAPYPAVPAVPAAPSPTGTESPEPAAQDRTEFLDDRTLLDPAVVGAGSAPEMTAALGDRPRASTPLPPRRPERQRGRRRGWLVSIFVILILAGAGGVFAFFALEGGWPGAQVATAPPPPPEAPEVEVPVVEPEPERDVTDAYIQHLEGLRALEDGNYPLALEHFERAVRYSPNHAPYRHNYALTLLRMQRVEAAITEFRSTVRQDPNLPDAHYFLAEALLMAGDTVAAIESLETVLDVAREVQQRARADRRLREVREAMLAPTRPVPDPVLPGDPPPIGTQPAPFDGQPSTTVSGPGSPARPAGGSGVPDR
jgi:hypothetical protein